MPLVPRDLAARGGIVRSCIRWNVHRARFAGYRKVGAYGVRSNREGV